MAPADSDLLTRLSLLYADTDPALHLALTSAIETNQLASMGCRRMKHQGGLADPAGVRQAALGAARLLAGDEEPRIAGLAFAGWDTHANEGGVKGQLAMRLSDLDDAIQIFADTLGPAKWKDTALMVVTEFGRTARINGTQGSDHGTGTVVFLAGGAIRGERVIADWPGLAHNALYEGRDLMRTTDVRSIATGFLAGLFGASNTYLADHVFPGTDGLLPDVSILA